MIVIKYKRIWQAQTFIKKELKQQDQFQYFIYRIMDEELEIYYILTNQEFHSLKKVQKEVDDIAENCNDELFDDFGDAIEAYGDMVYTILSSMPNELKTLNTEGKWML